MARRSSPEAYARYGHRFRCGEAAGVGPHRRARDRRRCNKSQWCDLNPPVTWRYEAPQGLSSGKFGVMSEANEASRPSGRTEPKGAVDGPSSKIGWDVAVVVIIGTTLACVGVALLVVGLLMH
jgi:hypothetical protein